MMGVTTFSVSPRQEHLSQQLWEIWKMKEASASTFSPNPVTYDSNMRNGTEMRIIQLGQNVYALGPTFENQPGKSNSVSSCSSSDTSVGLLMQIWMCVCISCTAVLLSKVFLKTSIVRLKWPESCSFVLVCSMCAFDILSWQKNAVTQRFLHSLILVMTETHQKQHLDHRGTLNSPLKPKRMKSFWFKLLGYIYAFGRGVKWWGIINKCAKTVKFNASV